MKNASISKPRTRAGNNFDLPIHLLILREELNRRTRTNSSYSLRSFAKTLDLDPSLLSKIMNNLRPISQNNAMKIMNQLNLSDSEKVLFWKSYQLSKQNTSDDVNHGPSVTPEAERELEQQIFCVISEPHHYALVELSRTKSFKSNLTWISKALNITLAEAKESVERLVKIGMLEKKDGVIQRSHGRFTTKDKEVTTSAHRYHQRKILEQAISAMDNVSIDKRNQSSMTIAVNPSKIPIAKKMITEFINQISDLLETGPLEEVYQMSFSLYPAIQKTQLEEIK